MRFFKGLHYNFCLILLLLLLLFYISSDYVAAAALLALPDLENKDILPIFQEFLLTNPTERELRKKKKKRVQQGSEWISYILQSY